MTPNDKITSIRESLGGSYIKPSVDKLNKFIEDLYNSPPALDYLKIQRGLSDETIKYFNLGYDIDKNAIAIPEYKGNELINIKYRHLTEDAKQRYSQEKGCEVWMFHDKGLEEAREGQSINLTALGSKTRRGRVSDIANTIDTGMQQYTISKTVRAGGRSSPHGSKQNWDSYEIQGTIRRLTPIECERLQGFPDGWTKYGSTCTSESETTRKVCSNHITEISDTQRYKTLGNAMTVNVVGAIINKIHSHYERNRNSKHDM